MRGRKKKDKRGKKPKISKIKIIGLEGKTREVEISQSAEQTLLALARIRDKKKINQTDIAKEQGVSATVVRINTLELGQKIGSSFYFPRGREAVASQRSVVSFLKLYGKTPQQEMERLKAGGRTPLEALKIKEAEKKVRESKKDVRALWKKSKKKAMVEDRKVKAAEKRGKEEAKTQGLITFVDQMIHPILESKGLGENLKQRIRTGELKKRGDIRNILKDEARRYGIIQPRKKREKVKKVHKPVFTDSELGRIYEATQNPRVGLGAVVNKVGNASIFLRIESGADIRAYSLVDCYLQLKEERGMEQHEFISKVKRLPVFEKNPNAMKVEIRALEQMMKDRRLEVKATPQGIRLIEERGQLVPKRLPTPSPGIAIKVERPKKIAVIEEKKEMLFGYGKKELQEELKKEIRMKESNETIDRHLKSAIESGEITTKSKLRKTRKKMIKEKEQRAEDREKRKSEQTAREAEAERLKEEQKVKEEEERIKRARLEKERRKEKKEAEKEAKKREHEKQGKQVRKEAEKVGVELTKKQIGLFEFWEKHPNMKDSELIHQKRVSKKDIAAVREFAEKQDIHLGKDVKMRGRKYGSSKA